MKYKLLKLLTGVTGIGAAEGLNEIDPTQIPDIAKALVQLAIAIVTLWQLFKKPKEK